MVKKDYDVRKKEIGELKEKIIDYFKKPTFDVTLTQLMKYFKLNFEDLNLLEYCLGKLIKEGWVKKSSSLDHYQYNPGEKLNFGGLQ